jgi:hypothetical protein
VKVPLAAGVGDDLEVTPAAPKVTRAKRRTQSVARYEPGECGRTSPRVAPLHQGTLGSGSNGALRKVMRGHGLIAVSAAIETDEDGWTLERPLDRQRLTTPLARVSSCRAIQANSPRSFGQT